MTTPPTGPARAVRRIATAAGATALTIGLLAACTSTNGTSNGGNTGSTPSPTKTGYHGTPVTRAAEPGDAPQPTQTPVGTVVALPDGTHPWGVAVVDQAHTVYLAARKQDRFAAYDMTMHQVTTKRVPGSARMIDLASSTGPLLLPAEDKGRLYELSPTTLAVESSAPAGKQPHQAVQVGDTTFVTEEYGHAVRVLRDGKVVKRFTEPTQPGGITAVGDRVAAVDVAANLLFVFDAKTLQLVAALPAGKGPSHVVPIGGDRVAVCDVRGNAVLTYDISGTPKQLGRAAVPGRAFWIGADADTGTIYTALANTNKIAELTVRQDGSPRLVATVPTVRNPVSFDRDPDTGDLYVGGYADSQLQIIPADAFRSR